MKVRKELEFLRKNKLLVVRRLDEGFGFVAGRLKRSFSLTADLPFEEEISFVEDDAIRIGDLIDALTNPDVLHPVHLDTMISPIGRGGKYKMHIKWEGYGDETKRYLPDGLLPSEKDLIEGLEAFGRRCLETAEKLKRAGGSGERLYERAYSILGPLFLEIFFPGLTTRAPFLRCPFRRLTVSDFKGKKNFSIRLTPSESRRLARFFSLF